ncbi:MAG TPA: TolC family protein [Candidatus Hydrogenedentes bacterium]|nr:TolC family protein [Candidatus Hydrogenedentota bacterium]
MRSDLVRVTGRFRHPATPGWFRRFLAMTLAVTLVLWGCSPARYRRSADRETYGILEQKSALVPGAEPGLSIDPPDITGFLEHCPKMAEQDESLGDGMPDERGCAILSLENAVILATRGNRSYQSARESVFLKALNLTLDRHRYTPIFSGSATGNYNRSTRDVQVPTDYSRVLQAWRSAVPQLERLTGTPASLLRAYADVVESAGDIAGVTEPREVIVDERRVTGETSAGVSLLTRGGGRIAATLTSNFLRFLTGDPRDAASSSLSFSFVQPLLEGSGEAAREQLTQSERNVLYALRDYTQFRKEFAVEICSDYYSVLRQRDIVRNTWRGLQNFRRSVEREQAFATEGLRTQAELGRIRQAQLDNESRYTNAVRQYLEDLDAFKIKLGLSTDARVVLDDEELRQLRDAGLSHPSIRPEDAAEVALAARLNLLNKLDAMEDAARRVRIAENALLPRVDLAAEARVKSTPDSNAFTKFDFQRMTWGAGLDVDPLFDRKAARNAYRSALIQYEAVKREADLARDRVKLEVREAWRTLEQARMNYETALQSVRLAERRVEEQNLLAELGQATAQDQVDAQNDLIQSQNALTTALISHTVARLSFWKSMGLLYIKKDGLWEETEKMLPEPATSATTPVEGSGNES